MTKICRGAFADCDNLQLVNFERVKDTNYDSDKFFNNYVFSNENIKIGVPLNYEGKTFCGPSVKREDNSPLLKSESSKDGLDDLSLIFKRKR